MDSNIKPIWNKVSCCKSAGHALRIRGGVDAANKRISQINKFLLPKDNEVRIGDVFAKVGSPKELELVPFTTTPFDGSQDILAHLRWMMQKGNLAQDMFLTGFPGPLRRQLALKYAQLSQREVEYVALSVDVTESDLKQRREIKGGTSVYIDQACIRAAIHGRLLILDGIERVCLTYNRRRGTSYLF
jgi:AAA domain (dynein-related subfamily)